MRFYHLRGKGKNGGNPSLCFLFLLRRGGKGKKIGG